MIKKMHIYTYIYAYIYIYTHTHTHTIFFVEFQRIPKRDKKVFLVNSAKI